MGGNFFTAKIVDGGDPQDGHGDMVAVLANQSTPGVWLTSGVVDAATIATTRWAWARPGSSPPAT